MWTLGSLDPWIAGAEEWDQAAYSGCLSQYANAIKNMSSKKSRKSSNSFPLNRAEHSAKAACSMAVVLASIVALAFLAGCASTPSGGASDPYQYNTATGYPAVGGQLWH